MSNVKKTDIDTILLRFAIGWTVSFLLFFNLIGWFFENIRWEYDIVVLPILCAVGAVFFFPLLSKWVLKRLTNTVKQTSINRSSLRRLWTICSLSIWNAKELEKYWGAWYESAKSRLVANDPLYDSWQIILQLAGGAYVETLPEKVTEVEVAPEEVIPAKVLIAGLQPAYTTTLAAPVVEEKVIEEVPPIPEEIPEAKPALYGYDQWNRIVSSSKSRKPPVKEEETLEIRFEQPSGVADDAEHTEHHEDFALLHVVPDADAPSLADTDHHIDYFIEHPVEETPVEKAEEKVEPSEIEAPVVIEHDTVLHHFVPEPEAPSLADMDVHTEFVTEQPVEEQIEEPVAHIEIAPPVEAPQPELPPETLPLQEPPQKYQFIPPKLPPLPEHPAFVRKVEAPVAARSTLPPPKKAYQSKARYKRENFKQFLLTTLMVLVIIAAGLGVYGLFRYVTNTLTNEPQLAAEATQPEPLPLASLKYTIDLGDRETLREANRELDILRNNGYAAYLYRELKRDGKIRLRVGHFGHKSDAQEVGRKMIDQRLTKRFSILSADSTGTVK